MVKPDDLITFFCEQAPVSLTPRPMFGGVGLYHRDRMVVIVYDGRFYAKTPDEEAKQRHRDEGMGPFRPNDRQTLWSYWEIPPDAVDERDALATWLNLDGA